MRTARAALIILFQEPFWIGLYEREENGRYEVARIVFGAQPKDYEVYDYLLRRWHTIRFSPALPVEVAAERHVNPKRMQRLIQRQTEVSGVGTKAQQALKLQQEQGKLESRTNRRERREAERSRQFELRSEKRKEKHRGH